MPIKPADQNVKISGEGMFYGKRKVAIRPSETKLLDNYVNWVEKLPHKVIIHFEQLKL